MKLLLPVPLDPDSEMEVNQILGVVILFFFWLGGILFWGRWISEKLKLPSSLLAHATSGTLFAIYFVALVGAVGHGLLSSELLFTSVLFLGYFLGSRKPVGILWKFSQDYSFLAGFVVLALSITTLFLVASVPHFHSDALMYNLVGPRLWYLAGKITLPEWVPTAFQCSYWEYLGSWAQALIGGQGARGLVEAHIFSQFIGVVLGYGGTALALYEVLRFFNCTSSMAMTSVVSGLSCSILIWTVHLAKNDWGICFLTLSGLWFFLIGNPMVSGLLLGSAFMGKFPAAFSILPVMLLGARTEFKRFLVLSGSFLLACMPLLFRNYLFTGSPFFPALNSIFKSTWLSQSLAEAYSLTLLEKGNSFSELFLKRVHLLAEKEILILLLPLPLAFGFSFFFRSCNPLRVPALISFSAISVFMLTMNTASGDNDGTLLLRYLGPALVLARAVTIATVLLLILDFFKTGKFKSILNFTVTALVVAMMIPQLFFYPLGSAQNILRAPGIPIALRERSVGGETKAWLRLNAAPSDLIVSLGDNQIYYISHLNVAVLPEQPYFDAFMNRSLGMTSFKDFMNETRWLEPKYLLDTVNFETLYWTRFSYWLERAVFTYAGVTEFVSKDSWVVSFDRLNQEINQACLGEPELKL